MQVVGVRGHFLAFSAGLPIVLPGFPCPGNPHGRITAEPPRCASRVAGRWEITVKPFCTGGRPQKKNALHPWAGFGMLMGAIRHNLTPVMRRGITFIRM